MKFLVLALCVCAASAATVAPFGQFQRVQPQQVKAFVAPSYVQTPVVPAVNTAYAAAQFVAEAPVAAAKAYNQAKTYPTYAGKEAEAVVVRSDSEVNPDGFNYAYETNNDIAAQASGTLRKVGDQDVVVIEGSYKYVDPEGRVVVVHYTADENGFHPESDILPVGPAIPEAILKSLDYISSNPSVNKENY